MAGAAGIPGGVGPGAGRAGTRLGTGPGRAEGVSVRTLAAAAGLVSARVHQITAGAPCGRDRGDRVGASMVVLQTGGAVRWHPVIIRGDLDGAVLVWRTADATPVIPPLHLRLPGSNGHS